MRLASRPLAIMVLAARGSGRPTVHHDLTGYDCCPALPADDKPFLGQDSQGVLQCSDPHALMSTHLLYGRQRVARCERPGADRVPNPDLSKGLMAAAGVRAGRFLDLDFRPGV